MFAPVHGPTAQPRATAGGSVWIVEDSPLEAEMARRALASHHRVDLFADGESMLERIANGAHPDALVLDMQLPTLSGLEVCRFVRASFDETALPILMLTIEGQRSSILEALAAGANDYLTKPYDIAELLARIGVLVRTSRLHAEKEHRSRHLALAADVGSALAKGGDDAELAQRCVAAIARHLEAPMAALFGARYGAPSLETAAGPSAAGATSRLVGDLARNVLADAEGRALATLAADDSAELGGARALAGVPLLLDTRVAGVLVVASASAFDPDDLDALSSLAQLIALGFERVRAERDRAVLLDRELRARSEVEAATRAKDDFLALVSHELRSPLNVILGWTDLLARDLGANSGSSARPIEIIRRNALAQARLIDDLLDVSRIISGKLQIVRASTDIVELVGACIEALRPQADAKNLSLTVDLECGRAYVDGDALRLKQVVTNLLTNAIKFTPPGGAITVTVRRVGASVDIAVVDTGAGIDAKVLPHVFDRFRQADGSMRRKHGGLGLGLSIVRHIIELHGGTVTAKSDGEGKGAAFSVGLPLADEPSHPRLDDAAPDSQQIDRLDGVDVVYIDDNPDAREFVARTLADAGANVRTAASVAEALEIVPGARPDVVVSDLGLPGEDGFAVPRKLRRIAGGERELPVLALTAYGDIEDRKKCEAAGFDAHLTKPIAPMRLVAAIASAVPRPTSAR